jgi:hypothetical protein
MNKLSTSLICLLLLAPSAKADALRKNRVPANARWLAHLDVEVLKSSKLYEVVHEESGKDGANEMDAGLAQFKLTAGLDPTMDFKAVTVYCASKSEKSCVAVLSGNARIDDALAKLRTMQNYRTTPVGSYMLHTWGDDHGTWYAYVHHKEGEEERVVVASQDSAELVRGIALLEQGGASLADAGRSLISATPAAGSILFAAAGEGLSELGGDQPASAVARLAKTIAIDVGEDRGSLWAHAALDARTPEDAQRIQQVLQGAVALAGLVGGEEQEKARSTLQHLADALHVTLSDTRVDADFRYGVQALFEDLKSLDESRGAARSVKKRHARRLQEKQQEEDR